MYSFLCSIILDFLEHKITIVYCFSFSQPDKSLQHFHMDVELKRMIMSLMLRWCKKFNNRNQKHFQESVRSWLSSSQRNRTCFRQHESRVERHCPRVWHRLRQSRNTESCPVMTHYTAQVFLALLVWTCRYISQISKYQSWHFGSYGWVICLFGTQRVGNLF